MDREIKTALGVAAGIAGLAIAFIFLIRYVVPAVLEAPFSGSLITASVLGIAGILVLVWAGSCLWAWAVNSLKR
ncbi:hypothetical protein [Brevundimonas sp.]|uniref:hypothetical protein n=1 Tax=Brevundimonas sp. TaxID=1871086 RepID=UPI00356348B4